MPKEICNIKENGAALDIRDTYERRINYMRVSVTDRCNLRCFYCMPETGICQLDHKDILRYEEMFRIIRIAVDNGIDKVRVTGGEPLIRKGIAGFIKDLSALKGINDLSLTTNGVLLADMAKELYDAGLKRINISIDSLKRDTFKEITRHDCLERVMDGLYKAQEVGFSPIKINVVIVKGLNDDEVIEFARLTEEHPFNVRFIEYMPIGDDNSWNKERFISSDDIKSTIETYAELKPVEKTDKSSPARNYKLERAKGEVGFISPISQHFCSSCNRIRLTADGKLRNCLFSEKESDLRSAIRSGKDDEVISGIIRKSIQVKPEGHEAIKESSDKKRSMHSIGG